ncbi:MAG TPA: TonB-dependent receptor [Steroidobacteraceae bacterium]|nr:TonB-dependent receptor [Steroidobacteraceae bacterium]
MNRIFSVGSYVRAALGVGLLSVSFTTLAQQAPPAEGEELESVVVTGSRIVRDGFEAPTPVSVLSADRIEERAASNIGDALNELPAFRGTQTPSSQGFSGGYVGGRVLDLRGLGTSRTLTLVDGKRFVPSTTQGTVDTNMIPTGLLERAEVVTGGASAAYGSDAVAGVVNFIVNEKMTGLKTSIEYGISSHSDDQTYSVSLSGGTSLFGGRGHFIAAGDFEKNDGVGTCITRDWCAEEWLNFGRPVGNTSIPGNNILPDIRPSTISPTGVINAALIGAVAQNSSPLRGITFNPDGTPRRFVYGSLVNSLYMIGGEGEGINGYFQGIPIKAATERYATYARFKYDLTEDLVGRVDLSWGHLTGRHFGAEPNNINAPLSTNGSYAILRNNAFLPRSSDPTLDIPTLMDAGGITSFQLGRHYGDYGNPPIVSKDDAIRAVFSLNGKISEKWSWDAYYQYGNNHYNNTRSNTIVAARMAEAYNSVRVGGVAMCAINADANPNNNNAACVPLNPFGKQVDPAAWAYVTGTAVQTNTMTEHVASANVQGELFDLWAGPISVAAGLEYRNDKLEGDADPTSVALGFAGGNAQKINGTVKVEEGFAETIIPLAKELPFAKDVNINGAARRTKYDRDGAGTSSSVYATTWKYGASWTPVDLLRFRGTKSRDIRAPNVSELFGPTTLGGAILNDPFRGGAQTAPRAINGANPNLIPEKADTSTLGVVISPQSDGFLGRMQLSVDYYKIEIEDSIGVLGGATIVTRCFQGATEFCPLITRDAGGVIIEIQDTLQNFAAQSTSGYDIEFSYRQPTDYGDFDFRVLGTIVNELITVDSGGKSDRAGMTGLRGGTIPGLPDYTLDALVSWKQGPVSANMHARYIPSGTYNNLFIGPDQPGFSLANPASSNLNDVPPAFYLDVGAQYDFSVNGGDNLVLFGAINNAFDKDSPRRPGANGSGNNVLFDAVGRVYKVGVRYKFF